MEGNAVLFILVLYPMIMAAAAYVMGRKGKEGGVKAAIAAGVIEFALVAGTVLLLGKADLYVPQVCGTGFHFTLEGFRCVYALTASFMWMMTLLFSKEYMAHGDHRDRYFFFQLMTLGAVMGVFLSADLFTTFVFFEIMSFTSYVWVAQEETKEALQAADTYLAVAVFGGLVLLMGLFLLYELLGTLDMSSLLLAAEECENKSGLYIAGICTLVGFGAKAGGFPLHIWLPKAHPVAPAPASALLSGILTKSGVFGILVVSCNIFLHDKPWGILLFILGLLTMFLGALLAVFSVDLKRTLACSSMSQIGFILTGAGMQSVLEERGLAVGGTFLHMLNHSLIKLTLFMIAGVIVMNLHKLNLNDIQGYGRKKPFLKITFLAGALGIAGIPLFNGYVSKTLLHESIVEGRELFLELGNTTATGFLHISEWIFLISGGMTLAYMTKLYVAIFVEENRSLMVQREFDRQEQYLLWRGKLAIGGSAVLLPVLGLFPNVITDRIANFSHGFFHFSGEVHKVSYFSTENLKGGFISIGIGIFIYIFILKFLTEGGRESRVYKDCWPRWLDLEYLVYRPLFLSILPFVFGVIFRIFDSLVDFVVLFLRKTVYRDRKIPHELSEGSVFTHSLGGFMDAVRSFKRRILKQPVPGHEVSYAHKLAMQREKIMETNTIIRRSLSFGLLLFYVGLVFTLIYLTWRSFFF